MRFLRPLSLALLGLTLLLAAVASLRWRMEHDTPLLTYCAFLMKEHGLVPYRDFFETSMPGTFAFHYAAVSLFGYGDAAFRALDLGLLALLLAMAFGFMHRFGRYPAALAALTFGLVYFAGGPSLSLQRDYLGVFPVAAALLLIPAASDRPSGWGRFAFAGFLFGLAALIKPHFLVGLPVVVGGLLAQNRRYAPIGRSTGIRLGLATFAGFALPVGLTLLWLMQNQALGPFLDMARNYLPLHNALTGGLDNPPFLEKLSYRAESTLQFGGYGLLLIVALLAGRRLLRALPAGDALRPSVFVLLFGVLAFAIYPAIAGKFWDYHYMPLAFFVSLAAALLAVPAPESNQERPASGATLAAILTLAILIQANVVHTGAQAVALFTGRSQPKPPNGGKPDAIAAWLRERLQPGDTVQAFDVTGGAVHAMLLARAKLATSFLYDYHFYHHVENPTILAMRRKFLSELEAARPRFIIDMIEGKPRPIGRESSPDFPGLDRWLAENYKVAEAPGPYRILERRG